MTIGHLVVGVDFSSTSGDVCARVAQLGVRPDGAITLVHAVPPRLPERLGEGFRAAAQLRLDELHQRVAAARERAARSSVPLSTAVVTGSAAEALCTYGRERSADLLVVGAGDVAARRARGVGSTAERVIRAAHSSVLVVAGAATGPYARPLVAVDLSPVSATVIAAARSLAGETHAFDLFYAHPAASLRELRHTGVEVGAVDDFVIASARACADDLARLAAQAPADATWRTVLREGDARALIVDEAGRNQADLIAIGARGHSLLERLLIGSVADAVVRAAPCDVLVAR